MKKIYKYVVSVSCFVLVLGFTDVKAEKSEAVIVSIVADEVEDAEWRADQEKLKKLMTLEKLENFSDQESCQEIWNILWFWAKKGNLEARANLFMLVHSFLPGVPQIIIPGRFGDDVSSLRDALILGIHSIGVQFTGEWLGSASWQNMYEENLNMIYEMNKILENDGFLRCLDSINSELCLKHASIVRKEGNLKLKLIPAFEEYAREIDMFIAQGMKPRCDYFHTDNLFKGHKRKHEEPLKKQGD